MANLELRNVAKTFGTHSIMNDISLTVRDGEFVALVGPSGCGKSTILRMVAGLEAISSGEILIGGRQINHLTPRERDIAMVFQSYALYPHMSVYRNMAFNLELAGKSREEISRRVLEAARMLELEPLLDRKPSQLSGGQRQRVAMGRAVVRHPSVFLFDEPLSNLDAKLRVQMRSEIKALHKKVGVTSIYVTHDQVEAMTLADTVVVLNRGVIQQQGSPLELYRQPSNLFVASFIGSPAMNFLPGTIVDGAVSLTGTDLILPVDLAVAVENGRQVMVGLRPEHLSVSEPGAAVEGTVKFIEPTGSQTFVTLAWANGEATVVLSGDLDVREGQNLAVRISVKNTYIFDVKTQQRISSN